MGLSSLTAVLAAAATAAASPAPAPVRPAAGFTVRADWFDRGNVRISTPGQDYADKFPCIWNAGQLPNQAEYDLDFPVTAEYALSALYTAAGSRPVDIYLDGVKVHGGFAGVTGSWQTSHAKWETQCTVRVTQGKHTVKLLCPGPCMPHVCALRFESPEPFPPQWKLARRLDRPKPGPAVRSVPKAHRLLAAWAAAGGAALQTEVFRQGEDAGLDPASRNELLQGDPAAEALLTPWAARLTLRKPDGTEESDTLALSAAQIGEMIDHALWLVEDYRTGAQAGPDYLEPERRRLAQLRDGLERNAPSPDESRVVRGGSWRDKPRESRSAARLPYRPYQRVYNVGFRVVCDGASDDKIASTGQ